MEYCSLGPQAWSWVRRIATLPCMRGHLPGTVCCLRFQSGLSELSLHYGWLLRGEGCKDSQLQPIETPGLILPWACRRDNGQIKEAQPAFQHRIPI